MILNLTVAFFTILVIGLFRHQLPESVVYILSLVMIRAYSGGYHANTYLKCYVITVGTYILTMELNEKLNGMSVLFLALMLSSAVILFIFAPAKSKVNEKTEEELAVYRLKSRVITVIASLVAGVGLFIDGCKSMAQIICLSIFVAAMLIIASLLERRIYNES